MNSSANLQFTDRSLAQGELNLDRDVGAQAFATDLLGTGGHVTYALGLFSGDGRNRVLVDPGLLVVGRVQVAPFGAFEDIVEGDLERSASPKLAVGAAAALNAHAVRERGTFGAFFDADGAHGSVDYLHGVVDGAFRLGGLSLNGEVLLRAALHEEGSRASRSAWGAFVQGGFMLTEHVEAVGRVGHHEPLPAAWLNIQSAVRPSTELAAGVNVYLVGHDLKVQSDVAWEPLLAAPALTWRTQAQLAF